MFQNSTIRIGTKRYISKQITNLQPLPALLQPWGPVNNIEQVISLQMMWVLQLNNTRHTKIIKRDRAIETTVKLSVYILMLIIISILGVKIVKRKEKELPMEIVRSKHDDNSRGDS